MKFRIGRIVAGAMALAAAAVMATAAGASASDTPSGGWDHTYSATGVKVYVEEHGDIISVCDSGTPNGHSAIVYVVSDKGEYEASATNGSGSCKTHSASDGGIYDLPEGDDIYVYYRGDGGGNHSADFLNDH